MLPIIPESSSSSSADVSGVIRRNNNRKIAKNFIFRTPRKVFKEFLLFINKK